MVVLISFGVLKTISVSYPLQLFLNEVRFCFRLLGVLCFFGGSGNGAMNKLFYDNRNLAWKTRKSITVRQNQ